MKVEKVGKYIVTTFNTGDIAWTYNGKRHNEDGPAYIKTNGYTEWLYESNWHRDDGPAVIGDIQDGIDGTIKWYYFGNLVYSNKLNRIKYFDNLPDKLLKSIIKYKLMN